MPTANNGGIWLDTTGNVLMADTKAIGSANAAVINNGGAWLLTFNAAATNTLVQSTAQAIQFTNNSDAPSTTARTVTFTATDKHAGTHSDTQTISVTAVNDAPTLTAFSAPVSTGNEDSQIAVTFADLQNQGDDADVDGTVDSFVIKAVSSGVLSIVTSAGTATAWTAGTNDVVDASHQAYWTPDTNANGSLNAFTAVAKDNGGLESATAIQATVAVTAVNDAPEGAPTEILPPGEEDVSYTITEANLLNGFTDVDADVLTVVDLLATNGTLTAIGGGWRFDPAPDSNGPVVLSYGVTDGMDTVSAMQGFDLSPVNDAPVGPPIFELPGRYGKHSLCD